MFYMNDVCLDEVIAAVIIAHILMWLFKMTIKGIKKLWKFARNRRKERMMNEIRNMMEQAKK